MSARRPEQHQRHAEVHQRRHHGDRQAETDRLEGSGRDQTAHRRHADAEGRDQNQRAFDSAGKILRLAMTVGMVLVGRPGRHRQHRQRHDAASEIHQRLDGVRKQADGASDPIGTRLQPHRHQGGRNRNPGEPG